MGGARLTCGHPTWVTPGVVRAADHGALHAAVDDRILGQRRAADAAAQALVAAADDGAVLERGAGTGRLAIALVERVVVVDGIDASTAKGARLRAQPGGERVGSCRLIW